MTTFKIGDKVKTIYGKIETICQIESIRIWTVESARQGNWYHWSKIWKVKND